MENPVTLACGTARHAGEKKIPQALESTMQLWLCFDEAGSLADEIEFLGRCDTEVPGGCLGASNTSALLTAMVSGQ